MTGKPTKPGYLNYSWLVASYLFLVAGPATVHAQLCFDVFSLLDDPSLACADAGYTVEGADGIPGRDGFGGSDTGDLDANFEGFDLFDEEDPDMAPPDNLFEPFFSDTQFNPTNSGGQTIAFLAKHRGEVNLGVRDSDFQSAAFGSRSRTTFVPFTTNGDPDPVVIELLFELESTLRDPTDNATMGGVSSHAGAKIFDDDPFDPLFGFSGSAELDLEIDDEPTFFGDFDGIGTSTPLDPDIADEFDIDVELKSTLLVDPDDPLILETDTFGSIFTDGFESGDTSVWSSSSPDTFKFTVSSPNPNVRFRFKLGPPDRPSLSRIHRFISFDNDGKEDVLLRNKDTGKWLIDFMNWRQVRPNSGPTPLFPGEHWEFVGTGDFNDDGRGDVLLRNKTTGGWWMFFMNGRSQVSGATLITRNQDWVAAAIDDFDGDDKDDVMLRHRVSGRWLINFMKFRQVQEHSGFTPLFNDLDWEMMGTGDFNMDGRGDVLLRNKKTGAWWIYLMNGLDRTGGPTPLFRNEDWQIAGIDDFDGDGKDDVLLRNKKTGRWYIFFMNARAVRADSGFTPLFIDLDWEMKGTGDFNNDDRADIMLRNKKTGEWWEYLMKGREANSGGTAITTELTWETPFKEDD